MRLRRATCGLWLLFSPWRCPFSLHRDPTRRRQRYSRPRDKLIGFVEQPLRRAPKGEVYRAALLLIVEGRKGLGFLEIRPVVLINPQVEHVVRHHPEHQPVAEHAGLAEHTPHRDAAERSQLLAQELGKAVAGNHPLSSRPSGLTRKFSDSSDPKAVEPHSRCNSTRRQEVKAKGAKKAAKGKRSAAL